MKPTLISLFSGAGGLDYGFEAAGFKTGTCVERDRDSCATLRRSRPKWDVIESDIFDVPVEEMLEHAGVRAEELDLVIGGPPCQPFSKAGYWAHGDSARLKDPRAQTLRAYLDVIEGALPRAFLLENVQGLAFKSKSEGLEFLQREIRRINKATRSNYVLHWTVLNAIDFGVPQQRQRLIIVAGRDGEAFEFPAATHGEAPGQQPHHTAWDALGDVIVDDTHDLSPKGKYASLLPSVPEGHNYLWHTERGIERAVEAGAKPGRALFGWRRHYWTFLLKLAKNRPSWTLQAQPGPASGPFHWDNRRLSARELCRLQTMPEDVVVQGSLMSVQRQVGNAVPSLLGEVLGREIRRQLLGAKVRSPLKLLPTRASDVPPPRPPQPVPGEFLRREGKDSPHPGTGLGRGACARASQQTAWGW